MFDMQDWEFSDLLSQVVELEWQMFDAVNKNCAVGEGREECQAYPERFKFNRRKQHQAHSREFLVSYFQDLELAKSEERNLMWEKYAYVSLATKALEAKQVCAFLPLIEAEKLGLIDKIMELELIWIREMVAKHQLPLARPISSEEDSDEVVSFDTYLRSELKTYSLNTLELYRKDIDEACVGASNLQEKIFFYKEK